MIFEQIDSTLFDNATQARHYFEGKEVDLKEVICAMPAYLFRNILAYNERLTSVKVSPDNATICGIPVIAGYENKLVFYWPEWHYHPHIKPLIIDIPDALKLK